jgi:hypothetical protein
MANTDVPAAGPWRLPIPVIRYERFPTTITSAACQNDSPNEISSAP